MFRFSDNVRPQAEQITHMMQWANNSGKYAGTDSVYGAMGKALAAIIIRECGQYVYDRVNEGDRWNFGGNESWLIDVEVAIDDAMNETLENMTELAKTRKDSSEVYWADRIAKQLIEGIDHSNLTPHKRQLRGNIRNLCCGMTESEMVEYYTQERNAGRHFEADCVLEFFAV